MGNKEIILDGLGSSCSNQRVSKIIEAYLSQVKGCFFAVRQMEGLFHWYSRQRQLFSFRRAGYVLSDSRRRNGVDIR